MPLRDRRSNPSTVSSSHNTSQASSVGDMAAPSSSQQEQSVRGEECIASRRLQLEEQLAWYNDEIFRLETEFLIASAELGNGHGGGLHQGLRLPKVVSGCEMSPLSFDDHRAITTLRGGTKTSAHASVVGSSSLSTLRRSIPMHERIFTMSSAGGAPTPTMTQGCPKRRRRRY
jgi:hypothetical protein